jgi:hypothetical protein
VLTEDHGTWAGFPSRFSYQWLDCDETGAKCSVIAGATGRSYKLKSSVVGHTIRVRESTVNATGAIGLGEFGSYGGGEGEAKSG